MSFQRSKKRIDFMLIDMAIIRIHFSHRKKLSKFYNQISYSTGLLAKEANFKYPNWDLTFNFWLRT